MKKNPQRWLPHLWLATLTLLTLTAFTNITNGQNKPNVVIMLGDNVGYGDIGAYGAGANTAH